MTGEVLSQLEYKCGEFVSCRARGAEAQPRFSVYLVPLNSGQGQEMLCSDPMEGCRDLRNQFIRTLSTGVFSTNETQWDNPNSLEASRKTSRTLWGFACKDFWWHCQTWISLSLAAMCLNCHQNRRRTQTWKERKHERGRRENTSTGMRKRNNRGKR